MKKKHPHFSHFVFNMNLLLCFVCFITTVTSQQLFMKECPYIEGNSTLNDSFDDDDNTSGNVINLLSNNPTGRSGNRFMTISGYLAMGYCCKSSRLILPHAASFTAFYQKEHIKYGQYIYDFSSVDNLPAEFENLHSDQNICRPEMVFSGYDAFIYYNVHKDLMNCVNTMFMRGCEKEYFGGILDTDSYCPAVDKKGDGSLVIHIRAGDIFNTNPHWGTDWHRDDRGQPPLQHYIKTIEKKNWDSVTVISNHKVDEINPTYTALEMMAEKGLLGDKIRFNFFDKRTLLEDVREMLCADGLAISRSTLGFLTVPHTRANLFFFPDNCGKGLRWSYRRKGTYDDTEFLMREKPDSEVYGIDWGDKKYSVYSHWDNTDEQLMEMINYDGLEMKLCN